LAFGAPLDAQGLPQAGRALGARGGGLAEVAAAVGTADGQVLALGARGNAAALAEGKTVGAFVDAEALGGPSTPVAAASGYLGDVAVVSAEMVSRRATVSRKTTPPRARVRARTRAAGSAKDTPHSAPRPVASGAHGAGWALDLRVQRHYSSAPRTPLVLPVGNARPWAVAVAIDFRSDVLLVWASRGAIYAREVTQAGRAEPVRRLSAVAGVPELRALYSDDGRAIVAWREQRAVASAAQSTSIAVSISDPALRFAAPRTVERFVDLRGLVPPLGSLRLARLSSEAVMMAWTGVHAGRYVVRASPVSLRRGVWAPVVISGQPSSTLSTASGSRPVQALLADLVPGPDAEAIALWTAAPRARNGALDPNRRTIAAAWGHYGGHGEARFAAPEAVSAPGPNGTPAAAFDPQNDMALAAWVTGVQAPRIVYAQREAGPPRAG
jgi:hypothetical protein